MATIVTKDGESFFDSASGFAIVHINGKDECYIANDINEWVSILDISEEDKIQLLLEN